MRESDPALGLAVAIVDAIAATWNVDVSRVYSTGHSNGGALSHKNACEATGTFAAIAPVAFSLGVMPATNCQPSRPISVIYFHGYNDLVVPYLGGTFPGAQESFVDWAQINGCTGSPAVTLDVGLSSCETYSTCDDGVEVTLCSIAGDHLLYWNLDVDIPATAWEVFTRFSMP
jgi:polyhydroxybutyrate depolymerase